MGRREMEHKGEKREPWLALSCAQGRCACSRGLQAFAREGESLSVSPSSLAATPSYEGPGPSFYRCKERVQVYTGGCSNYANMSGREEPEPYVHADVAVGEVLVPCAYGVVAVGGALEPCRSTTVGVVGSLLTYPCFRRGLRTAVVMGARGVPSLLVCRGEPDGTPVLFPVA
jgi:hypothetical protein